MYEHMTFSSGGAGDERRPTQMTPSEGLGTESSACMRWLVTGRSLLRDCLRDSLLAGVQKLASASAAAS